MLKIQHPTGSTALYKKSFFTEIVRNRQIYFLLIPAFIFFVVFHYIPMINGFIISLQDYSFNGNSTFAGLKHYKELVTDVSFWYSFRNTLIIGLGNISVSFIIQVVLALLLNEVAVKKFKGLVQTVVYSPYLFSWVAVGGIWISLLSPDGGMINTILNNFGLKSINFMTNEKIITPLFWFLYTWRYAGYGCIIFLAALTAIDPNLYEAARIDGAGRFRQIISITLPGLYSTMRVVFMLNLISSLRMFSQSLILSNPMVIDRTEVAMTYTYKMGLQNFRMDYASAAAFLMLVMIAGFTFLYRALTNNKDEQ